jgi:mycofactocin glycosyltransferase
VTDPRATVRLVADSGITFMQEYRVVMGGSPWRLSKLNGAALDAMQVLATSPRHPIDVVQGPASDLLIDRGFAHPVVRPRPGPHNITVVVPAYGRGAMLRRCLAALPDIRVVVVDDGTPNPDDIVAAAHQYGAHYLRLPRNAGPAAARNAGLRATNTPLVAFLDSDCEPEPNWLDVLVPHFDDPRVVAVAPRVVPRTLDASLLARFEASHSALDMGKSPALIRPGGRVGYVPSAALVVRRTSVADQPFDENLRVGEDVDLVWRLAETGAHVRYESAAIVRHAMPASLRAGLLRRVEYGSSAAPLQARHNGRLAPVRMSGWSAATFVALALGQPIVAGMIMTSGMAVTANRLRTAAVDMRVAPRLAAMTLASDSRGLGHALRREYWPLGAVAIAAAPWSRAARLATASMLVPLAMEWHRDRPNVGPIRYVGLRLASDLAYGTGVLTGCWQDRTIAPLRPSIQGIPGRRFTQLGRSRTTTPARQA